MTAVNLYILVDREADYPVWVLNGDEEAFLDFLAHGEEVKKDELPELRGIILEETDLFVMEGMQEELSGKAETELNTNPSVLTYFYRYARTN